MSTMPELLAEVADEARYYDTIDHAVRLMRRRRQVRRIAPLALALVVLAGLGITAAVRRPAAEEVRPTGPSIVDGLPRSLGPGPAKPFPADRAVGVAALVYRSPSNLDGVLVTVDGARYRLTDRARSLSPDGRWLVVDRGGQLRVRDLTGTAAWTIGAVPPDRPVRFAWARDGRRLAAHGAELPATLLDLGTGAVRAVDIGANSTARLCGLQDSGVVVVCARADNDNRLELSTVDGLTNVRQPERIIDLPAALSDNERRGLDVMGYESIQSAAGATTLVVPVYRYHDGIVLPSDALVVRVDTGAVVQRLTLPVNPDPVSVPDPTSNGVHFRYLEFWLSRPSPSGGLILVRAASVDGQPTQQPVIRELQHLDPATGARVTVTTVAASLAVGDVILRSA